MFSMCCITKRNIANLYYILNYILYSVHTHTHTTYMYRYDFQEYIIVVQCSNMYVVGVYISPAIEMIEWFFFGKGKECNYIIEC